VVNLAPRVALERTVPKNVNVIMEEHVMLPQANVIAVQDTQENGKEHSCLSLPFLMYGREIWRAQ
jgi:hypothetical protein